MKILTTTLVWAALLAAPIAHADPIVPACGDAKQPCAEQHGSPGPALAPPILPLQMLTQPPGGGGAGGGAPAASALTPPSPGPTAGQPIVP